VGAEVPSTGSARSIQEFGRKNSPRFSFQWQGKTSALPEKSFPKPIFSSARLVFSSARPIFSSALPEKSFPRLKFFFPRQGKTFSRPFFSKKWACGREKIWPLESPRPL